jgi:uncharacterized protein YbjT (DUF2867 family)
MTNMILVIGGTGMLGAPVVRALVAAGHAVRVMSRDPGRARVPAGVTAVAGDVTRPQTLGPALAGCSGVHISLHTPPSDDPETVEHQGTVNVIAAAKAAGVQRLTLISGSTVKPENAHFPGTAAKLKAEAAVKASGLAYTIFRPSSVMENLPRYVRGKQATTIGAPANRVPYLAAADLGRMVAASYRTPATIGKTLYLYGPEKLTLKTALDTYCASAHPGMRVGSIPSWVIGLIATLSGDRNLQAARAFADYYAKTVEDDDPNEANALLGAPTLNVAEWSKPTSG